MSATRQSNGLTVKQERFARAYIKTGNASEAYRQAYDVSPETKQTTIARKAHDVLADGNVAAMIDALRKKSASKHEISVDRITSMLIEDRELARSIEQPSAAVSANVALAKLHGLMIERKHVTHKHDPADLTDAELAAIAAGRGPPAASAEDVEEEPDQLH